MFASRTPRRAFLIAEPLQRAKLARDSVLVRESEEEFEARSHLFVKLEADVLAQILHEFRARSSDLSLAFRRDLFGVSQSLVSRGSEINLRDALARALA